MPSPVAVDYEYHLTALRRALVPPSASRQDGGPGVPPLPRGIWRSSAWVQLVPATGAAVDSSPTATRRTINGSLDEKFLITRGEGLDDNAPVLPAQ